MDKSIAELKRAVAEAAAVMDAAREALTNAEIATKEARSAFDDAQAALNEAEEALNLAKIRAKKLTPYQEGILTKLRDGWTIRVIRWWGGGLAYRWKRPEGAPSVYERPPRESSVLLLWKCGFLVREGTAGWGSEATYRIKEGV